MNELSPIAKPSLLGILADRYGMDPDEFYKVVKATVMPNESSREQTAAFLMVAKEYELSPLLKEIHAFKNPRTGGIVPVISIDGWSSMVNRRPEYDGCEFDYDQDGDGKVIAVTCRMWRKDRRRPTAVTEFLVECWRNSDAWKGSPARMLRHRAFMQAARLCFGFSGAFDPDDGEMTDITPVASEPRDNGRPRPPAAKQPERPAEKQEASKQIDGTARRAPPPGKAGSADTATLMKDVAARLAEAKTDEDIDTILEESDLFAKLTHDDDASDLMAASVKKARQRVQASE